MVETEQIKSFTHLFKLAQDIEELETCGVDQEFTEAEMTRLWAAYYRHVDEYLSEIDLYIKKYSSTRGSGESAAAFRFRVWKVTLIGGTSQARKLKATVCRMLF